MKSKFTQEFNGLPEPVGFNNTFLTVMNVDGKLSVLGKVSYNKTSRIAQFVMIEIFSEYLGDFNWKERPQFGQNILGSPRLLGMVDSRIFIS